MLDGIWHFHADPDDIGISQQWYVEQNFQYLDEVVKGVIPGCWNHYSKQLTDYSGVGWYFTNFEIPSVLAKKKIQLHFSGIHGDGKGGTQVYLDGKK